MKKRALISVSDKTGVVEFAKSLVDLGYEIISTGGTAKHLSENGIKNIGISDITNFPECLDGRVKTLHPFVHAGLLAKRSDKEHMKQLKDLKINTIDILAVNLYPFKETIIKENCTFADAVENIDIGGPTMLRAAAKNYQDVCVVVDPSDYLVLVDKLASNQVDIDFKKMLMYKVFQHTAVYDTLISTYLRQDLGIDYPEELTLAFEKKQGMRYGENPHQQAAFYKEVIAPKTSLVNAEQLNGKELSFNNINDTSGALDLLKEFSTPACIAVKHTNPCGVGLADTAFDAYIKAYECDPVSIFGGIVAFNRAVDKKTAQKLVEIFLEIVIAPDFDNDALQVLKTKPNLRVLKLAGLDKNSENIKTYDLKKVSGGLLLQDKDASLYNEEDYKVVTKRVPTKDEIEQMIFAYKIVKHVKSNGIAIAKDFSAIGSGGGQTNRIWAAQQAIEHAGEKVKGAVLASDAFFPFSDTVEAAIKAGITAIIQPGGSIRDKDSIDLCDKHGVAMVCVGMRHFKH